MIICYICYVLNCVFGVLGNILGSWGHLCLHFGCCVLYFDDFWGMVHFRGRIYLEPFIRIVPVLRALLKTQFCKSVIAILTFCNAKLQLLTLMLILQLPRRSTCWLVRLNQLVFSKCLIGHIGFLADAYWAHSLSGQLSVLALGLACSE